MATRRTFELSAGDTLYLPRGFVHDAHVNDETSLHITLGVIAYTWVDLMVEAVTLLAEEEAAVRWSLPLGSLHGADRQADRQEAFRTVLSHLTGSDAMERAWNKIDAHFVLSRPAILDGQLAQLSA